jgi:hypothetical protein
MLSDCEFKKLKRFDEGAGICRAGRIAAEVAIAILK